MAGAGPDEIPSLLTRNVEAVVETEAITLTCAVLLEVTVGHGFWVDVVA